MNPWIATRNRRGQTLLEIVMVLVLFSLLMTGANALFWNNSRDMLFGRKLIDATRLGENSMENVRATDWKTIGKWIAKPHEEDLEGFRVVRSAENVNWSGKEFLPTKAKSGYRRVTVSVFPPEDENKKPFRWVQLFVKK